MLKFFYNGIKENGEKLQKCWYSMGGCSSMPEMTITIYKTDYDSFSKEINEQFAVENESDSMTDYFCKDTIRVFPDHNLYPEVLAAYEKLKAHRDKIRNKRVSA
jgi:hypothetical protein